MRRADRIIEAARGIEGAPFRLHGRNEQTGVDCIGLVSLALVRAGHARLSGQVPSAYSMRGGSESRFSDALRNAGLRRVRSGRPGDVLLVQAGVAQFHLMIATDAGHIHAHAGLGRVVEMPGPSPWPVLARYRWGR